MADIGLMGGMFDPVHNGHLAIANDSLALLELDRLVLLPCGQPVHGKALAASSRARCDMLALAIADRPGLAIDDRECRSNEPSYTFKTLNAIRNERPGDRLYYVLGQDAFNRFHTWFEWEAMFDLAHVVVAARPGYRPRLDDAVAAALAKRAVDSVSELKNSPHGNILVAELALHEISSSLVRARVAAEQDIDDLVPARVADYIHSNALYQQENGH